MKYYYNLCTKKWCRLRPITPLCMQMDMSECDGGGVIVFIEFCRKRCGWTRVNKTLLDWVSGRFGSGRARSRYQRQERGCHQLRSDDRDGVYHLDHVDSSDRRDNRLVVRFPVADQSQAQQRTVAAWSPAIYPRHHVE